MLTDAIFEPVLMKKYLRGISFYILLAVIITVLYMLYNVPENENKYGYSDLINSIRSKQVKELVIRDHDITVKLNDGISKSIYVPVVENVITEADKAGVKVFTEKPAQPSLWLSILPTLALIVVVIIIWIFFLQSSQGGGGSRIMSFGKSRAKMVTNDKKKITFEDVAGADEEKEELKEIVDFLKNPKKYIELGARIPKGVLLVGPPGTGKTLLAKAVAGEAEVPFFSISGSDFVEMFVGVGASRVRDLFDQAKKSGSACIVFIDEIDAVGRHRGAGLGGGHDEREQTLNQLLVEMDGFGPNEGVIILAATNRPDILDPALLRPGRFDRQVVVGIPDIKGREEILKVHSKAKPLSPNIDLKLIAKATPGFTGADLENIMNEAALLAARKNKKQVEMEELYEAKIKVMMGPEKKSRIITEKERKVTAYHEAGHAIVSKLLPDTQPVNQVSIIPRGRAGGYTLYRLEEDKQYIRKSEILNHIIVAMGGRAAEKLIFNDVTQGAQGDIKTATQLARDMVTKYGMSEKIGPITFGDSNEVFLGKDFAHTRNYSEDVASIIDEEIKNIVEGGYNKAEELLKQNIDKLHEIAVVLLEKEKIDEEEFNEIFEGKSKSEEQEELKNDNANLDSENKNQD